MPQAAGFPRIGRGAVALIFGVALAVRLAAIGLTGYSTYRFGDAAAYLGAADVLIEQGRYPDRTDPFFFRAPGYPVFLAAATLGNPNRVALAKAANALLGAFSALLLAFISARLFRHRGVAVATGIAAALNPAFVRIATDLQSENLFLFLLLAWGLLLLIAADRPSSGAALAAGGVLALAALTRPTALMLTPLLLAVLADRRYPFRARAHLAGSVALGFLLLLAPWTARNAVVFRELIPVNDAGGNAFYQGNSDWNVRFYRIRSREEYARWIAAFDRDMRVQSDALDRAGPVSPGERSAYFFRKALAERRGDLAGWARLLAAKAWDWLRPYPRPWFWPTWIVVGIGVFYTVLTAFAAIALARAERWGVALFALAVLAVSFAAHVIIIVVWRYRVPFWDPILLLYGTKGAADTLSRGWRRSS